MTRSFWTEKRMWRCPTENGKDGIVEKRTEKQQER
jgi:hypothetical protein